MNHPSPISYEDRAKARAAEIRRRLMGTPRRVNVIREVLADVAARPVIPNVEPKLQGTHCTIRLIMPELIVFDRISDVSFGPRTMREIADEVLSAFPDVTLADIKSPSRMRHIVRPRQLIVHAIKTELNKSWPEIGRFIGGRDHTTALHAFRKIEAERVRAG